MKESRDRNVIKERVEKWMGISKVNSQRDALDMAILEAFFHIYYNLEKGLSIQEIGNDLGLLPFP